MIKIKKQNSNIIEPSFKEWLEEYINTDIIEITVLQKIHSLNDKASFDCVVYISNIINYVSDFKIVYCTQAPIYNMQKTEQQVVTKNCCYKNTQKEMQMILNPQQFITNWLIEAEASPFVIKFQVRSNFNQTIQEKVGIAIQIGDFIKSKISQKNLELLYDETINFINTMIIQ